VTRPAWTSDELDRIRYPSYVAPMVAPQARATTLKLMPDDRT
jgi:hypothetical protein